MENSKETLVTFHIGRGGKFNNQGHLTCKSMGKIDVQDYGVNIHYTFENLNSLDVDYYINDEIFNLEGVDVADLANDWSEESKQRFDALKLKDIDGQLITSNDLGNPIVVDDSQNEICTISDYKSNECRIDIDGDYNTYYWKPLSEITEEEFKAMLRDLMEHEYIDEIEQLFNAESFELLKHFDLISEYFDSQDATVEQIVQWENIDVFDSEEEAEEQESDYDVLEMEGKFYVKNN